SGYGSANESAATRHQNRTFVSSFHNRTVRGLASTRCFRNQHSTKLTNNALSRWKLQHGTLILLCVLAPLRRGSADQQFSTLVAHGGSALRTRTGVNGRARVL